MYPFLLQRLHGFQRDQAQLEADHVDLDATLACISARLRLLFASCGGDDSTTPIGAWSTTRHLRHAPRHPPRPRRGDHRGTVESTIPRRATNI